MNKTKIIKDIIGSVLAEKGFKYVRCEKKIIWTFGRKVENVEQEVYIQQHTLFDEEYKLIFWTSAKGNGMKEIGSVLSEYHNQEYWKVSSEYEFVELMKFFASFIQEQGFNLLEDMLEEKPDSFETPERKQYFKEHRIELAKKYDDVFHILGNGTREEQLKHIDEVLWNNREVGEASEKEAEIHDLWLGMAAILSEILLKVEGAEINYESWLVEISFSGHILTVRPIFIVVQAWLRYHLHNNREILLVWASARTLV